MPNEPMLPTPHLQEDLKHSYECLRQQPFVELLKQRGILQSICKEIIVRRLIEDVQFSAEECKLIRQNLFQGTSCKPPKHIDSAWIQNLPEPVRSQIGKRWDHLRIQKWMEDFYAEKIEAYFLGRRNELEQIVFRSIRVRHSGLADELYLKLVDDNASFGELARKYSIGEGRYTRGIVGPLEVAKLSQRIRDAVDTLIVGEISKPIPVAQTFLILQLEHRLPARLDEAMRSKLMEEMFQKDLECTLKQSIPLACSQLANDYPLHSSCDVASQSRA